MFSRRFNVSITENYGITEAGGICTNGFPHNNVIIKIIDEKENELGINQIGEIIVSGPGKAKGYLNQPHLTSKVFKNNFFYTGDLGKIDEKGKLQILCRKKNIINLKDKEIYPDEIIEVLCGHPNVKNALVRKNANEWLEAIVTLNKSCSAENLIEYCQKHLDEHKIPKNIKIQESLPYLWQLAIDSNNFNLHKLKGKA
ncbi:MAG: AMP-binding protein, partial [Spirochaetota bacterium]|nr:AMP-binding protein [Spirochaetota bacterium]